MSDQKKCGGCDVLIEENTTTMECCLCEKVFHDECTMGCQGCGGAICQKCLTKCNYCDEKRCDECLPRHVEFKHSKPEIEYYYKNELGFVENKCRSLENENIKLKRKLDAMIIAIAEVDRVVKDEIFEVSDNTSKKIKYD